MKFLIPGLLCFLVSLAAIADDTCPVNGPKIQWLADYCMYKLGTDDIITADPCMNEDAKRHYESDCAAKIHYKKAMCEIAISGGWVKKTPEQCFADPNFMGSTVRNGGVGN